MAAFPFMFAGRSQGDAIFVFDLFTFLLSVKVALSEVGMERAIRIIGIDPGLRRTGWGVIESCGTRLSFIAAGTVHSDAKGMRGWLTFFIDTSLMRPPSSRPLSIATLRPH
jgi:hypothetical protein